MIINHNNRLEVLGFVTFLSLNASCYTNELVRDNLPLSQKDLIEITGFSRNKINTYLNELNKLKIIVIKYDEEDNRKNRYFMHPYIFFQGQLNMSVLDYLLGWEKEIKIPYKYISIKENDVQNDLLKSIDEGQERYVYFIQNELNKEIKIGVTSNIDKRINSISSMVNAPLELLKLINGDEKTESELHDKFKKFRLHGEWFYPSNEIFEYINKI